MSIVFLFLLLAAGVPGLASALSLKDRALVKAQNRLLTPPEAPRPIGPPTAEEVILAHALASPGAAYSALIPPATPSSMAPDPDRILPPHLNTPMRRMFAEFPGLHMPPNLDEDAIRANCEVLGMPLRLEPQQVQVLSGGSEFFFLPLGPEYAGRLQKLQEQPGYHEPGDGADEDLREFLFYLGRSGLVSLWEAGEGGVRFQLSYEQQEFWFRWFDFDNKNFRLAHQPEA